MRYQLVPALGMIGCVLLTGWLWSRRVGAISMVGEAHIKSRDVVSTTGGVLVTLRQKPQLGLYDRVEKGKTVLAQLDTDPAKAALAVLEQERTRLREELTARQEELRVAESDRQQFRVAESRQLAAHVDELRLRVAENKAQLELERIESQRVGALYDSTKALADRSAVSQRELQEAQLRRDVTARKLLNCEAALLQAEAQLSTAQKRLDALAPTEVMAIDKILGPLHTRVMEHEQKMQQLSGQIGALTIVAPLTGKVSAIHRHPGETVQPGEPIMTITDEQSHHIVCYVRQDQRIRPAEKMRVWVRSREGGKPFPSRVQEVGPRFMAIPVHHSHAKDAKAAEWGLPVQIAMPAGLDVRPGELVDVTLVTKSDDETLAQKGAGDSD